MDISPYLDFKGECEAAFRFYAQCFGGTLGPIFRYAGTPLADQVPADWQGKVMHASVTLGNQVVMGADAAPDRYEAPKAFALSVQLTATDEAERIFGQLATRGKIHTPLARTFWAARFGVVMDQFGITWLINCDGSASLSDAKVAQAEHERST